MCPVGVQCRDVGPDIVLMVTRLEHLEGPDLSNQLGLLRPHMRRKAQKQMAGVPVPGRPSPILDPITDDVVSFVLGQPLGICIQHDPVAEDRGRLREQIIHLGRQLLRVRRTTLADLLDDRRVRSQRKPPELAGARREAEALPRRGRGPGFHAP